VKYVDNPAIGRFEGAVFDPVDWKPRVPTAAFLRARGDDTFWAARRVMAFGDDLIRAMAAEGKYRDEAAARLLGNVLIERRDAIGRTYLNAVNPVINARLAADGTLTFENAAVIAGVAAEPAGGYVIHWARFDNAAGVATAIGSPTATMDRRTTAPAPLPQTVDAIVKVQIAAVRPVESSWTVPVEVYFRRRGGGWTLVGVERLPQS